MRTRQAISLLSQSAGCSRTLQSLPSPTLILQARFYATHKDQRPKQHPAQSKPVYGQTSQSAFNGQEHVGPFPLGVGSSGRNDPWKPWKELGVGGKVGRTFRQSANLSLILLGGGLFVLVTLSLTTELFATNSPNVLYSKAVDMIRASDALNDHLLPPLSFTHSSHSAAPARGTNPVAHALVRNPSSGRDHLILTFYVHGRGKDEPEPMHWATDAYEQVKAYVRQTALDMGWIEDQPSPKVIAPAEQAKEQGSSWLGRAFGGLSALRSPGKVSTPQRGLPPPGTYKLGEARGDYVKNANGEYQLLSLTVDVPSSSASYPGRAVIFWSPEADREGLVGRRR